MLKFVILTAVRTNEARLAKWEEFDFKNQIWNVPEDRMKTGKAHEVPLTPTVLAVLQSQTIDNVLSARPDEFVFKSPRGNKPLSNMAMLTALKRMGRNDITVHGFRSTFRDWAGDKTRFSREVAEAALAHSIGNEVERAYRRSSALEKRRALMSAWSEYCSGVQSSVVKLHG